MKNAFPFCFGLSIGLHLAVTGLWQDTAWLSIGAAAQPLRVTLSIQSPLRRPMDPVSPVTSPRPEIAIYQLKQRHLNPTLRKTPSAVGALTNAVVTEAPATATANAATPGRLDSSALDNNASQISATVRKRLAAYFEYPLVARSHGWEGEVMLGLRLDPNGRMSKVKVVASSGYRILDRSALQSVRKADVVIEAIGWLAGRHIDLVLPVRYQLVDS